MFEVKHLECKTAHISGAQ